MPKLKVTKHAGEIAYLDGWHVDYEDDDDTEVMSVVRDDGAYLGVFSHEDEGKVGYVAHLDIKACIALRDCLVKQFPVVLASPSLTLGMEQVFTMTDDGTPLMQLRERPT